VTDSTARSTLQGSTRIPTFEQGTPLLVPELNFPGYFFAIELFDLLLVHPCLAAGANHQPVVESVGGFHSVRRAAHTVSRFFLSVNVALVVPREMRYLVSV
jgi:hypothetical protein